MPSMQGLGTSVLPVFEQLLSDFPGELHVLPCWPADVPVRFRLFSAYAGWVDVNYTPGNLDVRTGREIRIVRPPWAASK
jgi:hypothetical protein